MSSRNGMVRPHVVAGLIKVFEAGKEAAMLEAGVASMENVFGNEECLIQKLEGWGTEAWLSRLESGLLALSLSKEEMQEICLATQGMEDIAFDEGKEDNAP